MYTHELATFSSLCMSSIVHRPRMQTRWIVTPLSYHYLNNRDWAHQKCMTIIVQSNVNHGVELSCEIVNLACLNHYIMTIIIIVSYRVGFCRSATGKNASYSPYFLRARFSFLIANGQSCIDVLCLLFYYHYLYVLQHHFLSTTSILG